MNTNTRTISSLFTEFRPTNYEQAPSIIHDIWDFTDPMRGKKMGTFKDIEDAQTALQKYLQQHPGKNLKIYSFPNPLSHENKKKDEEEIEYYD